MRHFLPTLSRAALIGARELTRRAAARAAAPVASAQAYRSRFFTAGSAAPEAAHEIPNLETTDRIVQRVLASKEVDLSRTAIIGAQHVLETTGTLLRGLIQIGANPDLMWFSGKIYSTSPPVARAISNMGIHLMPDAIPQAPGEYSSACRIALQNMWQQFGEHIRGKKLDRIVILDDGGRCVETMPRHMRLEYPIALVEQTRGGLYSPALDSLPFPLIEVASSAVKTLVEPPMIAKAALDRVPGLLSELKFNSQTVFGIVGNGAIGLAIMRHLLSHGFKVMVYDDNADAFHNVVNKNFYRMRDITSLFVGADYVFGCTGRDITENINILKLVNTEQVLVSVTSEDKEFLSLLQEFARRHRGGRVHSDPLADVIGWSDSGHQIRVQYGGFPRNFDRKPWNVPATDIEVTQGLLLSGVIQAASCAQQPVADGVTINGGSSRQALNPVAQRFVARSWGAREENRSRYPEGFFEQFEELEWVGQNSGGEVHESQVLTQMFEAHPEETETATSTTTPKGP